MASDLFLLLSGGLTPKSLGVDLCTSPLVDNLPNSDFSFRWVYMRPIDSHMAVSHIADSYIATSHMAVSHLVETLVETDH